jgi:hypothetical protein
MKVTFLMCMAAALLPVLAAAQSAGTQPARQRSGGVETRDNKVESGKQQRADASSPGKSENAKGKKGEAPGQEKKAKAKNKK